jgi:ABC-type phosphate transport system substrate-binding protein
MHYLTIIVLFISMTASLNAFSNGRQPIIAVVVDTKENVADLKFTSNELRLIFLRKQLYWPMGRRIKPVNLTAEHPLRLLFSQTVLGSPPKKQVDYWNGLYFNGISPPYSVNSEEAVLRYISQTDGAIGYINACKLDDRVNPLAWIVNNQISMSEPATSNCDD